MAAITPTVVAGFIPEIWTEAIYSYMRDPLEVLNTFYDLSADVEANAGQGDTVHIPGFGALTAQTITPGSAMTPSTNTVTDNSLSLDQYKGVFLRIDKMAQVQSKESLVDIYAQEAAYALMQAYAAYVAGIIQSATTNDIDLSADNTLIDTKMRSGIAALGDAGVRDITIDVFGAGNPTIVSNMLGVDAFNDYDKTGLPKGAMSRPYGIPFFQSSDWSDDGAAGTEAASLWHKSAIAGAMQLRPTVESAFEPSYNAYGLTISTVYGAKLLFDARIVNFNNVT